MSDNIVGRPKALVPSSKIFRNVKSGRYLDFKEFLHIENLQTVSGGFRTDVQVVSKDLHVAPDGRVSLSGETANIGEISILLDLDECGSIGLANSSKLPTILGGPS